VKSLFKSLEWGWINTGLSVQWNHRVSDPIEDVVDEVEGMIDSEINSVLIPGLVTGIDFS
jgi:hypothetical protein